MKQPALTRRQFFKLSLFGASALASTAVGLVAVAAAPTQDAQAAAQQPQAPAIPQPTFNPIASRTTFGSLTDISMGWDGTLWGIDGEGAPHVYDSLNDTWAPHGDGIDAAAQLGTSLYLFKGNSFVTANNSFPSHASAPVTLASQWPGLPDSFKIGVMGAANFNDKGLILFNGGRFISTDGSIPLTALTSLASWPQSPAWPAWKDGVIDAVYCTDVGQPILLIRNNFFIGIDPVAKTVTSQPAPLSTLPAPLNILLPSDWITSGFDAGTVMGKLDHLFFKRTAISVGYNYAPPGAAEKHYISTYLLGWPTTWHPVLNHAPNGRDGNLWSVLPQSQGGWVVQHNGDQWTQLPNQADHVGVGQDHTVMLASAQRLWTVKAQPNNTGFDVTPVSQANNLIQVSLGNASSVFARDTNNNVYSFDPGSGTLTQNTDVGAAVHIAASNDGSLWHAKPSDASMHRQLFGSGTAPDAIPVKQGLVSAVQKVAGTGFGSAHCLGLASGSTSVTQAFRYDTPYVFKTATKYDTGTYNGPAPILEQGAGLVFFTDSVLVTQPDPTVVQTRIVALDAHTGTQIASTPWLTSPLGYNQVVFDPNLNLLYVGTSNIVDDADSTTAGQLLALDARTLAVKWSFTTTAGIDAVPALNGTQLCVGDRTGKLYMFDTGTALAAASANPPQAVQPKWTVAAATNAATTHRIAPPIFVSDVGNLIHMALWDCTSQQDGNWTAQGSAVSYHVADGSQNDRYGLHVGNDIVNLAAALVAPVYGKLNVAASGAQQLSPALYYHCYSTVITTNIAETASKFFALPAGDFITTGLTYDATANVLWFGTQNGTLYALDPNLNPVNHTPYTPQQNFIVSTTPVVYRDAQSNTTVLFGLISGTSAIGANLLGFDPDNGNIASLPTGATRVMALSKPVKNGVLYVGGGNNGSTGPGQFPQVFGIRVDDLLQAERDFIIESQLMQDPVDPGGDGGTTVTAPDGNIIPNSKSRYQTHLTLVDDQKKPQPDETIKIWADTAGTVILVNGTSYTIGPDDAAYAQVTTGNDGCVVVMSEATDINASALRAWAPFMDPFERIVVYPDHEWHARTTQSNANGNVADPAKPNLNTAYKHDGTTLFTADEKNQGVTTNVANAVGQMNTGLNPGGNSPASVAGALKTLHASNPAAPYIAYPTLGGMHYGPNNARLARTATIAAPIGFMLNRPKGGGTHTYTPLLHHEARDKIDALTGDAWDPNNPNDATPPGDKSSSAPMTFVIRRSDNIFTDFWNWLTSQINKLVSDIENVIVSVADDIMVGINFIINGVEKAFKAVIKVIEDVVNAIGSFFLQLAKLIEELIEALSVLFHFGEIIWFHNWIKSLINHEVSGLKEALTNNVKGLFDNFIQSGEDAIKGLFDRWRTQIGGQTLTSQPSGQSSVHSAFTIKDANGNATSQGVVAGANMQKMKGNLGSGQEASLGTAAMASDSPRRVQSVQDAVTDFFNGFVNRITGDGDLSASFSQLQSDFSNLFNTQSSSQFFASALTTLLDLLETVLIALLSVAGAFVDGVFSVIDALIAGVLDFMNTPLDIPFFSWLYKLVFGSDLTILDLVALVGSIPGTMIFRVATGVYPSQAGLPDPTSLPNGSSTAPPTRRAAVASPQATQLDIIGVMRAAAGVINGISIFALGIVSAKSDTFDESQGLPSWIGKAGFVLSVIITALSIPVIYSDPSQLRTFDWASYGVSAFIALSSGIGLFVENPASGQILSVVQAFHNACCLAFVIYAYIDDKPTGTTSTYGFIGNIFSVLPGLINPVKYLGLAGKVLAIAADVVGNMVWCALTMVSAFDNLEGAVRQSHRYYFPWVSRNSQPVSTPLLGEARP